MKLIETLSGFTPDGNSGFTEMAILIALLTAVAAISWRHVSRRRLRKQL